LCPLFYQSDKRLAFLLSGCHPRAAP
jgi:hypothetical protein